MQFVSSSQEQSVNILSNNLSPVFGFLLNDQFITIGSYTPVSQLNAMKKGRFNKYAF